MSRECWEITLGNLSGLVEMRGLEVGAGMYGGETGNKGTNNLGKK